ncbi:hypothetical protein EV291_111126 [Rhizobium sp. BK068]|nr:hypothetical protein EV291_111126 [Rhizobium sp. BK068]
MGQPNSRTAAIREKANKRDGSAEALLADLLRDLFGIEATSTVHPLRRKPIVETRTISRFWGCVSTFSSTMPSLICRPNTSDGDILFPLCWDRSVSWVEPMLTLLQLQARPASTVRSRHCVACSRLPRL